MFNKHQDVKIALGFETKIQIDLANPVSDFFYGSRLFMNIEKVQQEILDFFFLNHFLIVNTAQFTSCVFFLRT